MVQNTKKTEKRQSRAERRAAQEAAERAAALKAAKERKQQTIIGGIVVAIIAVLGIIAGVAIWRATHPNNPVAQMSIDEAYTQLQQVETQPAHIDDQGGILISKDGYGTAVEDAPTVSIYMDFLCPGCGSVHRELDPTLIAMMDAGQINLDLHFMAFMDSLSTDDYSTRAANAALTIVDNDDDPGHLLTFVSNMYASDFQPQEGDAYVPVSDDQIREQAIAAGVSEDVADKMATDKYTEWLDAVDTYTPKREELFNTSGSLKGSMSTPTLTINGHFWDINELSFADVTMKDGLLTSLGLDEGDVGKAGVMPSIGADGEPISVSTGQ